jgi:hypothetical protein
MEKEIDWTKAQAAGLFRGLNVVANYVYDRVRPLLYGQASIGMSNREQCLYGLFLREASWLLTMKKIDNPVHVQAVVACGRAMLETTVDMILIHCDKTASSAEKMNWWELSAKLKAAEKLVDFFAKTGVPVPDHRLTLVDFIKSEGPAIKEKRKRLFQNKHPDRWTRRTLSEDVAKADTLLNSQIKAEIGSTLSELYCTEFPMMNFYVHGSSLVGMRHISPQTLTGQCAIFFKLIGDLAMLGTKIILTDFGYTEHLAGLREEWESVTQNRLKAYASSQPELAHLFNNSSEIDMLRD